MATTPQIPTVKSAAARALLEAREKLIRADHAANVARDELIVAEGAFLDQVKDDAHPGVMVDGVVILLVDDWYDNKAGSRVRFHAVEALS